MHDVVITGVGVVSPLGHSVHELTTRFAAGECSVAYADGGQLADVPVAAIPPDKRARIGRLDRLCRFFLAAAYLAVEDAQLAIDAAEAERVGLSFGTGFGCLLTNAEYYQKVVEHGPAAASPRLFASTVSSAAAGEVSIALGIKGPNVTAHMGFAAGLGAAGYGFDLIQMGKANVVLAGGADVIGPALLDGLRDMGLLRTQPAVPFRDAVPGVTPSEAAVVAVLESHDHAVRRGARCLGRIDGYAAGFEPTLTRHRRHYAGLAATMRRALHLSGESAARVSVVMSSAHGTPVDDSERAALVEVLGERSDVLVFTPKRAYGECFGAAGMLSLALSLGLACYDGPIADGLGLTMDGAPRRADDVAARCRAASVVMIDSICYSGSVVTLLLGREA